MADFKEKAVAEVEKLFKIIDEQVAAQKPIADIIAKTGQRAAHVASALVLVSVFLVLYISGPNALCNLIGFAYPIYASFKALKTDGGEDDTQWLTYWVVFGFFTLLESLFAVFSKSLFYFLFKGVFLIWAFLPQTLGAKLVFDKLIEPILNRYEGRIDGALHGAKRAGENLKDEVKDDVNASVGTVKKRALASAIDTMVADAGKKAE